MTEDPKDAGIIPDDELDGIVGGNAGQQRPQRTTQPTHAQTSHLQSVEALSGHGMSPVSVHRGDSAPLMQAQAYTSGHEIHGASGGQHVGGETHQSVGQHGEPSRTSSRD